MKPIFGIYVGIACVSIASGMMNGFNDGLMTLGVCFLIVHGTKAMLDYINSR